MTEVAWKRVGAGSGAAVVVLFACGLLFGDLLAAGQYPAMDAPFAETRAYFVDNAREVRALAFFHLLAALALVVFAVYLQRVLAWAGQELQAGLALGGGLTAAVFLLLSALCYRVLAEPVVARDEALSHALVVLSYLAGGVAIGVPLTLPIGVLSLLALRRATLPSWLGWIGALTAALSLLSALSVLGEARNDTALYGLLLLAAMLDFVWLVAASLVLVRRA